MATAISQNDRKVYFVVNCEDDAHLTQSVVVKELKLNGLQCKTPFELGGEGRPEIEVILSQIDRSHKSLLVLSNNALNSQLFKPVINACLRNGHKRDLQNLVLLLLEDNLENSFPNNQVFRNAPKVELNVNHIEDKNYVKKCLNDVYENLKVDVKLSDIFPLGSLAEGRAWEHFVGFLQHILPRLKLDIRTWLNKSQNRHVQMPVCFYILLPKSCRCSSLLSEVDENIREVDDLKIEADVGGTANRPYYLKVYEVKDYSNGQVYHCVAEYPSALGAISKLHDLCSIPKEENFLRFYYFLSNILDNTYPNGKEDLGKYVHMVPLSDSDERKPSTCLLKAIKEDINNQQPKRQTSRLGESLRPPCMRLYSEAPGEDVFDNKVCILCSGRDEKDRREACHLEWYFKENHRVKCSCVELSCNGPQVIDENFENSYWCIFVLSRASMNDDDMKLYFESVIRRCIEQNQLRVVPLLIDVKPDEIPAYVSWVTYIDKTTEISYADKLKKIVQGQRLTTQSQLPIGDVAVGFSMAFYVNYLQCVLGEIGNILKKSYQQIGVSGSQPGIKCCQKLYQIVPKSCKCEATLTDLDDSIIAEDTPEYGESGRKRRMTIYKIEGNDKTYYFAGEFASPIKNLHLMNQTNIAGLNIDQMHEQANKFCQYMDKIFQYGDIIMNIPEEHKKRFQLVIYDDLSRTKTLSETLQDLMDREEPE